MMEVNREIHKKIMRDVHLSKDFKFRDQTVPWGWNQHQRIKIINEIDQTNLKIYSANIFLLLKGNKL